MDFIGPFLFIVIVVTVVVILANAISARGRRSDPLEVTDPGIGTVRRLYFYTISFVALMMAANGVVQIAQYLLDAIIVADVVSESTTRLAVGISLLVVGLPLWAFHWRRVQRYVRELPVEKRSLVRKLYLYLVLGVAIGVAVAAGVELLQWAFRSESFSGYPWAALVVWSGVWAFHWLLESAEGQSTSTARALRRIYLYLVSAATLVMAAVGIGHVIYPILLEGYGALVSEAVLLPSETGLWRPSMRDMVALVVVGGVVWGVHWIRFAARDHGSFLRQVYLYIFAILGGVVTTLVSGGIILYGLLVWLMGVPEQETASAHFRLLPGALASLAVGFGLWAYHWLVVREEAETIASQAKDARRLYAYVLAALGLGALVVAIATLVATATDILVESARSVVAGGDFWQNQMAVVITLVVIGAPLWGYYWASLQRQVRDEGAGERASLTRRIFIFAVLGAGALALLGSTSYLIFVFLRDWFDVEAEISLTLLREAKVVIGIMVAAGVFVPYYWMVNLQDRRAQPDFSAQERERPRRKGVAVLVPTGADTFVARLEAALGYPVQRLAWADPEPLLPQLSEGAVQAVAQRIGKATGQNVLLIPQEATVRVLSYE